MYSQIIKHVNPIKSKVLGSRIGQVYVFDAQIKNTARVLLFYFPIAHSASIKNEEEIHNCL